MDPRRKDPVSLSLRGWDFVEVVMLGTITLAFLILVGFDSSLAQQSTALDSGVTKQLLAALKRIEDSNESRFPMHFKPGHYEITARVIKSVIDAGDEIEAEVYITGFGLIQAAKVTLVYSSDVFDNEKSNLRSGSVTVFSKDAPTRLDVQFGSLEWKPTDLGGTFTFPLGGEFKKLFPMYPINPERDDLVIFAETWRGSPPVHLRLTTKEDTPSGIYHVDFYLTYFDGTNWQGSKHRAEFKVRNILERNQLFSATVVLTAAILGCMASVLVLGRGFRDISLWMKIRTASRRSRNTSADPTPVASSPCSLSAESQIKT